ncbi:hypothetical protein H6G33_35270 [Calothrix sp. FACHB-1219]|nr:MULTISPECIES: hypothetical protein [unclassified Calothrix]MBD2207594.1 hypothetical protein [Calothrix sp. FACHB-168]MBD2222195.1 hypothetical protein [Calothrix sp. FACHB-1219]
MPSLLTILLAIAAPIIGLFTAGGIGAGAGIAIDITLIIAISIKTMR